MVFYLLISLNRIKGSFVCEIVGEIKKYTMDLDAPDYLIKLSELGDDQFGLDSSRHTNVGRFVNHSCDPNLVLVRALIEETGLIIDILYICPTFYRINTTKPNEAQ